MAVSNFVSSSFYEHRFWLQVLGDHSRFIYRSLSPSEQQEIKRAELLIADFDRLLAQARAQTNAESALWLTNHAAESVKKLKKLKLHLLHRLLVGNLGFNITPTFLNHMLNELEEYELVLRNLQTENFSVSTHPLHHHLL